MGRAENIAIFEDSRRLWETDPALRAAVADSRSRTRLLRESDTLTCHAGERRFWEKARVRVSRRRTLEAAQAYQSRRVCVLNFASPYTPGGGVAYGSGAQEECLCRISTLYPCLDTRALWDGFYTPHRGSDDGAGTDDCIYTPDVVVFKADTVACALLPETERWRTDVITCAAPDLRASPALSDARLKHIVEKRVRRILDLAAEEGADTLILGAFGCGVFGNPPELVAAAMRGALEAYQSCFETVEFAVYCPPGHDETNYRAFRDTFSSWN